MGNKVRRLGDDFLRDFGVDPAEIREPSERAILAEKNRGLVENQTPVSTPRPDIRKDPIEGEVDLHKLTIERATQKAERFIENSKRQGKRFIGIVTGKGNHSEAGAVIKPAIEKMLSEMQGSSIVAFTQYAGGGAFKVQLK